MEKRDFQPKTPKELFELSRDFSWTKEKVAWALANGYAFEKEEKNPETGELKSYKVFDARGVLVYYEDVEAMNELESRYKIKN